MRTIILASLLLAVTSASSFAGTPLINARQNAQQHRIFKGVQQGDLTFNETLKLEQGQQRIRNMKNQAKASGGVCHDVQVGCCVLRCKSQFAERVSARGEPFLPQLEGLVLFLLRRKLSGIGGVASGLITTTSNPEASSLLEVTWMLTPSSWRSPWFWAQPR